MANTAEIHLSLQAIWDFLCRWITEVDCGPYPQMQVIIGGNGSSPPSEAFVEIVRMDALVACAAWEAFAHGNQYTLNHPRLGRVLSSLGYLMGLRAGVLAPQAMDFGAWLAYAITAWHVDPGQEAIIAYLNSVASHAACATSTQTHPVCNDPAFWSKYYQPAVKGVLAALTEKSRSSHHGWIG